MADGDRLAMVALAISAYRSDDSVLALLRTVFAPGQPAFGAVIVVDSLGGGAIEQTAATENWVLHYINADRNLGSAGNLDLRLSTAAGLGFEWCFAVNHDGEVDPAKVAALTRHGASRPRVGAVYPQLIFSAAGGRLDQARRSFSTYGLLRPKDARLQSEDDCVEVAWSSSNGALYNLDAVRDGARAWPELWMGYEDLALGWELQRRGWKQLLCRDVRVTDNYEFRAVRLLGRDIHLADKPSWYMYYQQRNLALIARQTNGEAMSLAGVAGRLLVDIALISVFRDQKIRRLRLLLTGLSDGLRGTTGKGPVP